MLLATNVAGRIGDRHGHLLVMRLLAIVGTTMIASLRVAERLAGHGRRRVRRRRQPGQHLAAEPGAAGPAVTREYSRATGVYNAFYAAGMLLGPPISSQIFHLHGGGPMLYHLAALWAAFVVFAQVFRRDDPRVGANRRGRRRSPPPTTCAEPIAARASHVERRGAL